MSGFLKFLAVLILVLSVVACVLTFSLSPLLEGLLSFGLLFGFGSALDKLNIIASAVSRQAKMPREEPARKAVDIPSREPHAERTPKANPNAEPEAGKVYDIDGTKKEIICPACGAKQRPDRPACWRCGAKFRYAQMSSDAAEQ